MSKPLIAVFRGGHTDERVISMQSAERMLSALDTARFRPVYITLTRAGTTCESAEGKSLPLDASTLAVDLGNGSERVQGALIAIHGPPGEDGKLQGFLDLLGIPYQTGGVTNMAITFSKYTTCAILERAGVPVAPSLLFTERTASVEAVLARVGLPCFVKPDQSGSSLGISKVGTAQDLEAAFARAFEEGPLIMVEAFMPGREFTCGVLRMNGQLQALPVCEIRTDRPFFDYHAKYHAKDTQEIIPAPLTEAETRLCQERSMAIYELLNCRGMVRVDHILGAKGLRTIEVNTTPGFSAASIYPKMLEVAGIGVAQAVNTLAQELLPR
jgi:D-alanine-D-alanine ligase